jgi:hypothetical protein
LEGLESKIVLFSSVVLHTGWYKVKYDTSASNISSWMGSKTREVARRR